MTDGIVQESVELTQIYDLLYSLGITANYSGFFYTSYAVYLAVRQPERLLLVTKWLYPEVAEHYHKTWKNVERGIRTVTGLVWKEHRERLEALARCSLPQKPGASKFIAILVHALTSSRAA